MPNHQKIILDKESSAINFLESVRVSFMNQPMCKVGDFLTSLKRRLLNFNQSQWDNPDLQDYKQWFTEGYAAEVLDVGGSSWRKGRVKINISLEFIPDELEEVIIESPLDDIRQSMNES